MTQAVTGPTPGLDAESHPPLLAKHHFLLRRLHSLTGLMPVGVFLCFHLFTNFQMVFTRLGFEGGFQHEVDWIHSLPALLILEIFGLWLPIAFHAALGVAYMLTGERNMATYRYEGNVRYTIQRWTAWIALFFILYHVATLRWGLTIPGFVDYPFIAVGIDDQQLAFATTALALQGGPLGGAINITLYLIGALATVYHFANGLWTAAITWGLTLTVDSMRKWGWVCLVVGLTLGFFAIGSIWAAATYDVTDEEIAGIKAYVEQANRGDLPAN